MSALLKLTQEERSGPIISNTVHEGLNHRDDIIKVITKPLLSGILTVPSALVPTRVAGRLRDYLYACQLPQLDPSDNSCPDIVVLSFRAVAAVPEELSELRRSES